ncbi:metalloprotease PmbA [Alcanivorax sp. HI0083]|uniref:metalloprotease PmbA n=1 Tax=unclassified Alcanivorax TaxID=2638842 RepID=UPI0007B884FA|nr:MULTISPECIES: metalloprotease PmbA [unclassified Alcanivorax]KZY28218.1 metalloprotease PmbA [Alcanivorax sp. HI0044]KZZ23547.1 metalloprotease PmbA [Alcanivorax sp. HI0083]
MSDSSATTAELDNTQLQQAKDTAAWLIEEAKRQGADAAEVGVSLSQGYSVNVRQGEVETVEFHRDRGVSVTVYKGQRKGHASSSDDNRDSLRATLAAATAIAGYTEEDRYAGLAPAADLAKEVTDLDLYHPWAMDTQSAIEQALRCETVARDDARIVNSEGASVNSGSSLRVYATSEGFLHGYRGTHHSRVCSVVAEDEAGMQRDYWYDGGRVGDRLASAEAVGEQARERALARLGAEVPQTGELPVIFAPEVASGLLGHLVSAISGGALYRRSSFLQDSLGKAVLPAGFQLTENPHLAAGNASAPFDGDGLPTRAQAFVEDGVLKQYALGLYASRRLDMAPTGNGGGVRNVRITDTGDSLAALMARVPKGILITEVMGQGINLVTGDYSRGASGFWFENGVIQGALQEFTIAGHLGEMLLGIQGSGTDVDYRGNIACGSLLLSPVKIAGR